jgi:hypothetical protein
VRKISRHGASAARFLSVQTNVSLGLDGLGANLVSQRFCNAAHNAKEAT